MQIKIFKIIFQHKQTILHFSRRFEFIFYPSLHVSSFTKDDGKWANSHFIIYIYKSEKNKLNSSTYKAKQVVAHEELPTATDGGVDCTLFESWYQIQSANYLFEYSALFNCYENKKMH